DKTLAFWLPDEAMAKAVWQYHNAGTWQDPDPTADEPLEQRYYPPPILQDKVDTFEREADGDAEGD
ncbi:MAG: hypothetical protein ACP5HU_01615, partial [Phycisphaerae bacterium]